MPPLCPLATEERADPRLSCQSSGRVKVSTERVPAPPRLTYDYVKWESGQWRGPKHHRSITSHILLPSGRAEFPTAVEFGGAARRLRQVRLWLRLRITRPTPGKHVDSGRTSMKIYPHVTGLSWADPPRQTSRSAACLCRCVKIVLIYVFVAPVPGATYFQERPAKVCLKFHASLQHRLR